MLDHLQSLAVQLGHDQVVNLRALAHGMLIRDADTMSAAQLKQSIWQNTHLRKPEIILQAPRASAESAMGGSGLSRRQKRRNAAKKKKKKSPRTTQQEMQQISLGIARTEQRLLVMRKKSS